MSNWAKKAEDQEISQLVHKLDIKAGNIGEICQHEQPDVASPEDTSLLLKMIRKGLVETNLDSLEVQRNNPSSPLYSVKTFEALHLKDELLKGIYALGFNAPSKIQETALPILLADPPQNMIAQSQSGTGKTAAFVLAMLSRVDTKLDLPQSDLYPSKIQETALPILLADPPQNMIAQSQSGTGKTAAFVLAMLSRVDTKLDLPQVLCLSPTYELAIQTGEVAARMAKFCPDIKLKYAVRGEEVGLNTKLDDHIIIGTPGKILDWGIKYKIFDLQKIRVFVLDEADVMIATQGHHDQCIRIHKQLSSKCQMLFFSATYDKEVRNFAQHIVSDPTTMLLPREEESLENIKQYYVKCRDEEEKYNAIQNIYGGITIGQAIIFCHTRRTAGWLAGKMCSDGHSVAVLSGDLTVEQRLAIFDRFRSGLEKVLITTNVLSRGIDVQQVTVVVNFDLPMDAKGNADCETYLHRIGRTGRFGKNGIAINLVDSEKSMSICRTIENHFKKSINLLNADNSDEIEKIGS